MAATYAQGTHAGATEVDTAAKTVGYKPKQHGWKLSHAARAYPWEFKGSCSRPLGYLGRILVTLFVTTGRILYELHVAFNPFLNPQFPVDKQNPLNLIFDMVGQLVANTYGQPVALLPRLSPASPSTALQAYARGSHSEIGFLEALASSSGLLRNTGCDGNATRPYLRRFPFVCRVGLPER